MNATSMPATLTPVLYLIALTACCFGFRSAQTLVEPATSSYGVVARSAAGCLPTGDGYLRARIRGEQNLDIDWHDAEMQCDGGLRPDDHRGMRVTFAGSLPHNPRQVRLIFGISAPADIATARAVP